MKKEQTVLEETTTTQEVSTLEETTTTQEVSTLEEVTKEITVCNRCKVSEDRVDIREFEAGRYKIHLCKSCTDELNAERKSLSSKLHQNEELNEVLDLFKGASFFVAFVNFIVGLLSLILIALGLPTLSAAAFFMFSLFVTTVFSQWSAEQFKEDKS